MNLHHRTLPFVEAGFLEEMAANEEARAHALIHERGMPPRQARKGKDGSVVIPQSD
jgi:hypothetical protein